jgi:hypothetical protein
MAPSQGGASSQDPRISVFLKWSAGLATPLLVMGLAGLAFLLVALRDGQRDTNAKITLIMESDRRQNVYIERREEKEPEQDLKIYRVMDQVKEIQRHLGIR